MQPSPKLSEVISGVRYTVGTASLLASNEYWDGHNWERGGRNTHLYRSPKGYYFAAHTSQWQDETSYIETLTTGRAQELFEDLREHEVDYDIAFPETPAVEA